jgi:hypothetical protein
MTSLVQPPRSCRNCGKSQWYMVTCSNQIGMVSVVKSVPGFHTRLYMAQFLLELVLLQFVWEPVLQCCFEIDHTRFASRSCTIVNHRYVYVWLKLNF